MPFDDPNNIIDSLNNFETTLTIIKSLIERFSYNNTPTITLGDFNSDVFRKKRFDNLLLNFISANNLIHLSQIFTQKIDHTFPNDLQSNNHIRLNLDHVLINERALDTFLSIQCNVVDDLANMSDHKALITTLELNSSIDLSPLPIINYSSVDFTKKVLNLKYNSSLDVKLDCLMLDLINHDQNTTKYTELLYEKVISAILDAENETVDLQNQLFPPKIHKSSFKKSWFTPELTEIKKQLLRYKKENNLRKFKKTKPSRIIIQNYLTIKMKQMTHFNKTYRLRSNQIL